jgi:hypothetical protein
MDIEHMDFSDKEEFAKLKVNNVEKKKVINDVMYFDKVLKDENYMQQDKDAWERINNQSKINMFGDKDRDKIPNILDNKPFKKNKKSFERKVRNLLK